MGRMQRNKGARGELEAAEMLRKHLGIAAERAARNGVTYYNLFVPGYTRMSLADIEATIKAGEVTTAQATE